MFIQAEYIQLDFAFGCKVCFPEPASSVTRHRHAGMEVSIGRLFSAFPAMQTELLSLGDASFFFLPCQRGGKPVSCVPVDWPVNYL